MPGELRLIHTSILASSEPVFRFDGSQARVWVDESTSPAAGRTSATLVTVDNPRNLSWRGRSNLYSQIGLYLTSSGTEGRIEKIDQFSRWCETAERAARDGQPGLARFCLGFARPASVALGPAGQPDARLSPGPGDHRPDRCGRAQGPFGSSLKNVHLAQRTGPRRDEFAAPSGASRSKRPAGRESNVPGEKTTARVPAVDPRPTDVAPAGEPPESTSRRKRHRESR